MTIHSAQGGETQMSQSKYSRLINFLQEDLAISTASLAVALRHREQDPGPLAMILWQYGWYGCVPSPRSHLHMPSLKAKSSPHRVAVINAMSEKAYREQ